MSLLAQDLLELSRMPRGALVEHLLRELACNLIAPGVADVRGGMLTWRASQWACSPC